MRINLGLLQTVALVLLQNFLKYLKTNCLTAVKFDFIRYYKTVYERSRENMFWSIKHSGEVLSKLKSRGLRATSLSTNDFSTVYTTLVHNLIIIKLLDLIERVFKKNPQKGRYSFSCL